MAHPCYHCQGECYCSGDFDDCIVSTTPARCEGCGCAGDDDDDEYYDWPDEDDDDDLRRPNCPQCGSPTTGPLDDPQCRYCLGF